MTEEELARLNHYTSVCDTAGTDAILSAAERADMGQLIMRVNQMLAIRSSIELPAESMRQFPITEPGEEVWN